MIERVTGADYLHAQWIESLVIPYGPIDDDLDPEERQSSPAQRRDRALVRASIEVDAHVREAIAPDRLIREQRNAELVGRQGLRVIKGDAMTKIGLIVEHYAEWLSGLDRELGYPKPYAVRAATFIARRSSVTVRAIGLLLVHGYTQDALGRWRSLFELASTAALLARPGTDEMAHRYLVHAGVVDDDPASDEAYRQLPYEWARPYFIATRDERRRRITQTMIFQAADLTLVDYPESVGPAHGATHLDSYVVGRLSSDVPGAPYGFDPQVSDGLWHLSVSCLYEAVSACAYLATTNMDERARLEDAYSNAEWSTVIRRWVAAFPNMPVDD